MRIISKEKVYDIPYELSVFWRDENIIWANVQGVGKIIMAQYSPPEKAEKAMQMLHEAYTGAPLFMNNLEVPDDFAERLKDLRNGIITILDREDNVRIEQMNTVFRFPAENEI